MRFGLITYPKKLLIIAHSGVSRETRCLKVVWSLLKLADGVVCSLIVVFPDHTHLLFLFMREEKALARSCVHAGSSEPSPHADVIRTIISGADQFIVLILNCGPLFYFLIQFYNLNS